MNQPACEYFARLEKEKEWKQPVYECLDSHLACVAVVTKCILKRVYGDRWALQAVVAGLLHDVGKVLHNIMWKDKVLEGIRKSGEGKLSFVYHEILSVTLLGYYLWVRSIDDYWTSVRAIAMHHQGLRGVAAHVYSEGFAEISRFYSELPSNDREKLAKAMANVIRSSISKARSLDPQIGNEVKLVENLAAELESNPGFVAEALEHARILLPHWLELAGEDTLMARSITGALMLADVAVARASLERIAGQEVASKSVYVSEALMLTRRLAKFARAKVLLENCV